MRLAVGIGKQASVTDADDFYSADSCHAEADSIAAPAEGVQSSTPAEDPSAQREQPCALCEQTPIEAEQGQDAAVQSPLENQGADMQGYADYLSACSSSDPSGGNLWQPTAGSHHSGGPYAVMVQHICSGAFEGRFCAAFPSATHMNVREVQPGMTWEAYAELADAGDFFRCMEEIPRWSYPIRQAQEGECMCHWATQQGCEMVDVHLTCSQVEWRQDPAQWR